MFSSDDEMNEPAGPLNVGNTSYQNPLEIIRNEPTKAPIVKYNPHSVVS